jgi:hypothetical protein
MALVSGLEACLARIVDDLLGDGLPGRDGKWSRTDYGLLRYGVELGSGQGGKAAEILSCMDARVRMLTNGKKSVVFAGQEYFATQTRSTKFALVPEGEDDSSLDARYFGLAAASNGVYESPRASEEAIAQNRAWQAQHG